MYKLEPFQHLTFSQLFMDKILTKDIRVHDKPTAYVSAVSGNLENVDFVLDYIIKNTKKWSEV